MKPMKKKSISPKNPTITIQPIHAPEVAREICVNTILEKYLCEEKFNPTLDQIKEAINTYRGFKAFGQQFLRTVVGVKSKNDWYYSPDLDSVSSCCGVGEWSDLPKMTDSIEENEITLLQQLFMAECSFIKHWNNRPNMNCLYDFLTSLGFVCTARFRNEIHKHENIEMTVNYGEEY